METTARAGRRKWAGLAVLCLPTMLTTIDLNVMLLALPHISADLDSTATEQLWMIDIYGFVIAGFLITMGAVGDRIGRRRLLLIGAVGFIGTSLMAAFAVSSTMLIVARALIGVAGATVMPTVLAMIRTMFADPKQMSVAMALWGTSLTAGVVLGPIVGGLMLGIFWWGAIFLIALPIMGVVLVVGPFLVPESRDPDPKPLDPTSVAMSLAAILTTIYGLKEIATHGWSTVPVSAVSVGVVVGLGFIKRQRTVSGPLLDLNLLRDRAVGAALVLAMGSAFVSGGIGLVSVLYLQLVSGLTPLRVGLLLLMPALALVIVGNLTPIIARKVRPSSILVTGLMISAIGAVIISQAHTTHGLAVLLGGLIVLYLGSGPIGTLIPFIVMSAAPREKSGTVGSLPGTVGEFGVALGVAVLGLVSGAVYRANLDLPAQLPAPAAEAAKESLAGAMAVAADPDLGSAAIDLVTSAQGAFGAGLGLVGLTTAFLLIGFAVLAAAGLQHVPTIDDMSMGAAASDDAEPH